MKWCTNFKCRLKLKVKSRDLICMTIRGDPYFTQEKLILGKILQWSRSIKSRKLLKNSFNKTFTWIKSSIGVWSIFWSNRIEYSKEFHQIKWLREVKINSIWQERISRLEARKNSYQSISKLKTLPILQYKWQRNKN